jgi:mannitol-1-phosphate/altronate dehydrogenase
LGNFVLWNADLSAIPGLVEKITENVEDILQDGMLEVIQNEKIKI